LLPLLKAAPQATPRPYVAPDTARPRLGKILLGRFLNEAAEIFFSDLFLSVLAAAEFSPDWLRVCSHASDFFDSIKDFSCKARRGLIPSYYT
jgi:hypothetical protein